jgi:hypothetical protein
MKTWDLKQLAGCKDSPNLWWIIHGTQRTEIKADYCKEFYPYFFIVFTLKVGKFFNLVHIGPI